jgi:hypothetical protein
MREALAATRVEIDSENLKARRTDPDTGPLLLALSAVCA